MTTTEQPIDVLKSDPANPRLMKPEAATGLGFSMETFDDIAGITWNERTGEFVAGHQRVGQLRAAGATTWTRLSKTEGFIAHPKTGARFGIRIVDWDPTKQRAANLVANNPHLQGEFTPEALVQLKAIDDDVDYAGLRLDALQATLEAGQPATEPGGGNTDPDAVPEPPKVPVTQPGDLWVLGDHRLLCGDSTKAEDVARLMAGEKAFVMNTDPPYGVDYGKTKRGMPGFVYQDTDIVNDTLTEGAELQAFLEAAIRTAVPHLTKTCAFYLWHPMLTQGTFFAAAAAAAADILIHRQIIWVKPGFVLTRSGMYHWKHELCFYGWVRGHAPPWYGQKNQTSVIEVGRDNDAGQHPTQKPVALFEFPILNHTRKGQPVYEPFSGSGSQIIAGERLGRPVRAMEIEPRWADVAVLRWEQFTGKKATRQPAPKRAAPKPTPRGKRRRK